MSVKSIYWRCLGHSEGQKISAIIKCHSFHMYSEAPPALPPSPTVVMTPSLGCHYSCHPLLGEATFMCACVFLRGCACSRGCKCTCVRIHMWGRPTTLGCPQECHLLYFRLWLWTVQEDKVGRLRDSPFSSSPELTSSHHSHPASYGDTGNQTQVFVSASSTLLAEFIIRSTVGNMEFSTDNLKGLLATVGQGPFHFSTCECQIPQ